MAVAATSENESMIRTWAALASVSLGIFAITLDGSMMPVAIGSIVNNAYLIGYRSTLRILIGAVGAMLLVSLMFKRRDTIYSKEKR